MMAHETTSLPTELVRTLAEIWPEAQRFGRADNDALPVEKGAYVVLARLSGRLAGALPGKSETVLEPGWYLYCGSARGPGGLKARISRHLAEDKKIRWHIDRLTTAASTLVALPFAGAITECQLAAAALASDRFSIPLPGFGSSDCRTCQSHLLRWEGIAGSRNRRPVS